jgi:hypothetical protein
MSLVAEYGVLAAGVALLALLPIARVLRTEMQSTSEIRRDAALTLLTLLAITGALGLVDPVLRLPVSLAYVAASLGCLLGMVRDAQTQLGYRTPWWVARGARTLTVAVGIGALGLAVFAGREALGLAILRRARGEADVKRAVRVAPFNIETNSTLAKLLVRKRDCMSAYPYLRRVTQLAPYSGPARVLLAECGYTDPVDGRSP